MHTEMVSDGIIDLMESGAVTGTYLRAPHMPWIYVYRVGEHKVIGRDQVVTSFCMGSRKLYDYINDNPSIKFNRVTEGA